MRVAYLDGYISKMDEPDEDAEPEPVASSLERSGKIVCLPGK